jgi:ABC-type antimicrobial peptide transport system permease subunit
MALGAAPSRILYFVIREGLMLAISGMAIGLIGSLAITQMMSGMLYGVNAMDPLTFTAVAILLSIVAVAGCYAPAWRASKVDPILSLRQG